ncbi:MAG: phenylacetate--CoA ligase family protein [Balneolaceae bacterium]
MNSSITNIKFLRFINSKVPPHFRVNYSYYKKTSNLLKRNLDNDEIKKIQLDRINKIVEVAWKIPGYKNFWKSNGFNRKELTRLSDYKEIPPIDKAYIRSNFENFTPSYKRYKLTKTGGSTGNPFQIYDPIFQQRIEQAFIHTIWRRFYKSIDVKTKSTILRGGKFNDSWSYDPMRGLFLSSYKLTQETSLQFIKLIDKYKTPVLHAYPSSLFQFSKYLKKLNVSPDHKFKLIALGSEPIANYQKDLIYSTFSTPIVNWYGHGEKVILAGNKPDSDYYYIEKLYGITELLNEQSKAIDIDEEGELTGTSLWNDCMPLIRYRTGDRAIASSTWEKELHQPEILSTITGRKHEYLVTKKKTLVPVTALTLSYGKFDQIKRVQFIQNRIGEAILDIELMDVNKEFDTKPLAILFKELMGDQIDIKLNLVEQIKPTKAGKHIYLLQKLSMSDFDNE